MRNPGSLGACATLCLLHGCSNETPWVGTYRLDGGGGYLQTLACLSRDAAERNVKEPSHPENGEMSIVLELGADGTYLFSRNCLGTSIVTAGTYAVAADAVTLTPKVRDGQTLTEAPQETGTWRPGQVTIAGWGTLAAAPLGAHRLSRYLPGS